MIQQPDRVPGGSCPCGRSSRRPRPPNFLSSGDRAMSSSVQDILGQVRDNVTVKRVFGDPYEVGGVTFVPVARVGGAGGTGAGKGSDPGGKGEGSGWGGGFGFNAEPAGAYV